MQNVRVWDLPLRLFHWCLVVSIVSMVVTAQLGAMEWHFRVGYFILSLLMFRLIWGFIGGHWARFCSFVVGPVRVLRYLSGADGTPSVGHNPLGALSVLGMLGVLALQVASGMAADDEIAAAGPLSKHLESSWVVLASWYHTKVGKIVLLTMIALHIGAIVRYRLQGHNLVTPMVTGDKALDFSAASSDDGMRARLTALLVWLVCAGVVAGVVAALG